MYLNLFLEKSLKISFICSKIHIVKDWRMQNHLEFILGIERLLF